MRFLKGHGTENDFVILPDPDGELELTPSFVARLCDRRAGIGADGVLRAVRAKADPEAAGQDAEWFMDYRNGDGSVAEMCGNGVRVFARYLVDAGLAEPGEWNVATRSGPRPVALGADGDVRVDMGVPDYFGTSVATLGDREFPGVSVSVGNPHLACRVDEPVAVLDLGTAPGFDPAVYPHGVNVEFFRPVGDHHVEMRVHERGAGETRSCGTGTVAVAVAAALGLAGAEPVPPGRWTVDVPGGRVTVTLTGETAFLAGPAVLVAEGEVDPAALSTS
ncbi:diaminopimelate epimerase [Actinomadura rayongensis]|uniref:Diaminopimelate epimerase n=1 Tax=Actinomadura rayongensis TaxID=1429076 RepID=A0A6I4W9C3_9ACTN|nr:diaminopimelate epimerase [Actinomadura rayongensis]MXQ63664.1 diaminopimelate epimerase [Actinomadura rayongensis]